MITYKSNLQSTADAISTLVVIFRKRTTLALSTIESTRVLHLGNKIYLDHEGHRCNGYYDWLRNANKSLIGIRLEATDTPYLCNDLRNFSYVKVKEGWDEFKEIEIYFSVEREYDKKLSHDQDFVESRILQSTDGEYAIAFSTHFLESADLDQLSSFDVDWETLSWGNS
jgi:hypothetical protein